MASTTFFGNRARAKLLNTWVGSTYTFTAGSTSFSGSASVGDYVWKDSDGVQAAVRVVSAGVLAYAYRGAGGTGTGYRSTPETLAVLRGLETMISWEAKELYGTDSVFRVDEARHNVKVDTKIKYSKWDCGIASDWMMYVLNPTSGGGTIEDTNTVYTNGVVYTITGSNGTSVMEVVCGKTYWDGVPYPVPENDFIIRDIAGHAKSATVYG